MYFLFKVWNDTICAKNSNDEECNLFVQKDFIRLSFDVLGECVFGYEFNSIEAGNTPVTQAFQDFTTGPNMGANTLTRRLLHFLPFHKRSIKRKFQESLKTTSKVIKQVRTVDIQVHILISLKKFIIIHFKIIYNQCKVHRIGLKLQLIFDPFDNSFARTH